MKKKIFLFIFSLLLVAQFGFSQLTGQYSCGETNPSVSQIKPRINIINNSGSSVNLSNVTVRYYFEELGTTSFGFNVDYAVVGSSNVTGTFSSGYVQIGFSSGAGSLANGASSGEIQLRINKSDWSNFNQSDDYSFDPTITSFTNYSKITVFLNGVQVWGEGPIDGTPTQSPEPTNTPTPYEGDLSVFQQRFLDLWNEIHDPANNYFSPAGAPYHSDVTVVAEAPDHGHASTSEAYSYYIWLEVMYGRLTGDWSYLDEAWDIVESQIIPSVQVGNNMYDSSSPASYAAEWDTPNEYPTQLMFDTPVGDDPVSDGLIAAYGDNVYGMHWLLDCDNFYGYGGSNWNGKPVFINTFQRGIQESVFETIPHPSIEEYRWGGPNGFLDLYTIDASYAQQWRYTTAPDAEARIIQTMYWAKEAGYNGSGIQKASKMGDFTRLSFFDKYFKPIAANTNENSAGSGYNSCHYLISWYYSWGGGLDGYWAWKIGSSHAHQGYQNVMAAWIMANDPAFAGQAQNCTRDWEDSLERQIEFLQWLQSADGLFGGGATNSWKGRYAAYPAGKSTFYGMAYDQDPVYEDPGSNEWFGMQAWGPERLCEYYYVTGDPRAKTMLDKFYSWVEANIILEADGTYRIPVTLTWQGEPDTWTGTPSNNSNLRVSLASTADWDGKKYDIDMSSCLAKGLAYYAKGTEIHDTLNESAKDLAYEMLERNWNNYRDEAGLGIPEEPFFLDRWMTQEVYVPAGWTGTMANGDVIQPGITFLDIRSNFRNDPLGMALIDMYNTGVMQEYTTHRFWGEVDAATAYLVYDELFGSDIIDPTPTPDDPTPTPDDPTPTPDDPTPTPDDPTPTPDDPTPTPDDPTPTPIGPVDATIMVTPEYQVVGFDQNFDAEVRMNSGDNKFASYGLYITYTNPVITLNTSIENGVEEGEDGFIAAMNTNTPGRIFVSGFDAGGVGPGADLHLLTVHFTAGGSEGTAVIDIEIDECTDENAASLNVAVISATVDVGLSYLLGDVDEDGEVDIVDALLIAQYYVDLNPPGFTAPLEAGDVDLNGNINIVDALLCAQYYVGIIDQLPPLPSL